MNLADLNLEQLTALHRQHRAKLAETRQAMDQIEAAMRPHQARAAVVQKLRRAGLTADELKAL